MSQIIKKIREELKGAASEKNRESGKRFFKEPVKMYGAKSVDVGKIGKKYWPEVKGLPKEEIFSLCEELFRSDYCEEAFIAAQWLPDLEADLDPGDLAVFENWIGKYINNWAKCDTFCNHTVGGLIGKYPGQAEKLKNWARSDSRWLKRAAAVSLIVPAKKGEFLKESFEIADILMLDPDDMVQKGYGWLLKEESRLHQKEVFDYVAKNKKTMPRTALRYAIELMPKNLKIEAMKR
ncbi:MAG: DNA alkylation repair protein [Candidatus Paceibacterota bacterium]|jgi:3-methyladenine DNA glycosylase AlkD